MTYLGVNIGGTTCSVCLGTPGGEILSREAFPTRDCRTTVAHLAKLAAAFTRPDTLAAGISCGGPLDPEQGTILSPPNLPGWDAVPIVREIAQAAGRPAFLMNDANAGALAEWYFGTDCRCRSLVFLTCGTGMGAGILIDGRLVDGACQMAGEVGHLRLTADGPTGYGKQGSFEGWCSGGGFSQVAGRSPRDAAAAARQGDPAAQALFAEFGRKLGQGVAALIDVLNPERISIGGIYMRCEALIAPAMREVLARECLPPNLAACRIVAASSGEKIGDLAALAAARHLADADPMDQLIRRFPELAPVRRDIQSAADRIVSAFERGNKLLLCGNGGSRSDCEHIAGELLKSFRRKRPLQGAWAAALPEALRSRLQGALPAIPLGSFGAFSSAFSNDVSPATAYAQEAHALGVPGDVLLAISTSGRSENVVAAAQVARAKGLTVIGLTGSDAGALGPCCETCIRVPARETYRAQELHLPVYHAICMRVEDRLFVRDEARDCSS